MPLNRSVGGGVAWMTETEWLSSNDPAAMLRSLAARYAAQRRRGESPDLERLRLFACACCRRVWKLLDEEHRKSVVMIESVALRPVIGGSVSSHGLGMSLPALSGKPPTSIL